MDTNNEAAVEPVEQVANITDQTEMATPEELGVGQRQSNEPFSPIDFDNIIDKAFEAKNEPPKEEVQDDVKAEAEAEKPEETQQPAQETPKETEKEEEKPEAKEEQAKTEEEKPAETKAEEEKSAEKKEASELDAIESKLGAHTSPKTKKLFNEVKSLAAKEKQERERVAKELEETRKQLDEIKKAKEAVPENVTNELNELRDKLRQLDANADPAIVQKYDKSIEKNNDSIIKILSDSGLPKEHCDKLKKSGITLSNLKPYLDTLESGKGADGKQYDADPDTAEKIREAVRENLRIGKEKETEIANWRSNYEQRTKKAEEEQKVAVEQASQRLTKEFDDHVGRWDFLKKPADVMDTDAPAIRKQKEEAINRFNDISLKFADAIKKETSNPLDAQIAARVGILYRDHIAPTLKSRLEDAQKEIAALQSQVNKMKQSGSAAKSIGTTAPRSAPKQEVSAGDGFDDIVDAMANQMMNNRTS